MDYAVFTTEEFDRLISRLNQDEQRRIEKLFRQLRANPCVGDMLRYRFLREKRLREKRIYYLVYDDLRAVLVVALGGKKTRPETIDEIVRYFPAYRRYLEQLLKN